MDEIPAHRACASCRNQKVRCIPDDGNPDVCQRCKRAGRTCVFTPLQKRKQRKRTDTRVAELEKQMQTMRAMLKEKEADAESRDSGQIAPRDTDTAQQERQQQQQQQQQPKGLWYRNTVQDKAATAGQARGWNSGRQGEMREVNKSNSAAVMPKDPAMESTRPRTASTGPVPWPSRFLEKPVPETKDPISSGMISMATARHLFQTYKTDLFPHCPLVHISESITADELRATKPALFLSVIAAASAKENSELSAALDKEVLQSYATRSIVHSQKSLEMVQALLISGVWYHPPQRFAQLKYFEYISMASAMALDLGIGSRQIVRRGRTRRPEAPSPVATQTALIHPAEDIRNPDLSMAPRSRDSSPDTASIEARRTFLSCYVICAGMSLSLRRPNMLRVSNYIRDCADYLERASNAIPTDANLVAWVHLIIIAEEIGTSFSYDDPGGIVSITDLRTQMMVKDFDARLTTWSNTYEAISTGTLNIMYHTVRLYLFEIALHIDHAPEDFKAPYQMGELQPIPDADKVPTPILADCVAGCINSAHAVLSTFLSMDVESLRALPVFTYVRISFAAFVLAKLSLSASHHQSRLARVLDKNSLEVESYMDRSILHVRNIIGTHKSRVPSIFLALLFKLRQWCLDPTSLLESADSLDDLPPSARKQSESSQSQQLTVQSVIELDSNRITEHVSSSGSSPQTVSPGESSGKEASRQSMDSASQMSPPVPSHTTGITTYDQPVPDLYVSTVPNNIPTVAPHPNFIPIPQVPLFPTTTDPMEVDNNNPFQFLGDVSGFPEGGLTGLDDWADLAPNELAAMGQMELMSWQFPGPFQGGPVG